MFVFVVEMFIDDEDDVSDEVFDSVLMDVFVGINFDDMMLCEVFDVLYCFKVLVSLFV